ncbi:MAG TPA: S8 family peptidase [Candidatus Cryosericum sp.]|nr:S8 family peptidase [Candidatus Cryosericum sp.]
MARITTEGPSGSKSRRATDARGAGLPACVFLILLMISFAASSASADPGRKAGVAPDLQDESHRGSPDRMIRIVATLEGSDSRSLAEKVKSLGGSVRGRFRRVGAMVMEVPAGSVEALSETEGVRYLSPDRPVTSLASQLETTTGADATVAGFLSLMSYNGNGVRVAVLDSGADSGHVDLIDAVQKRRVVHAADFSGIGKVDDLYGHGTHVAGIIAGDGSASALFNRDYTGMAPAAGIVNLRVLDNQGRGNISNVIAAIDYAIAVRAQYNIRVMNLSLAAPPVDSYVNDPMCQAVARATSAGIVVVAAAGNFGQDKSGDKTYGSITSPGISPAAITVGAADTRGSVVRSDDVVAPFSSRGPTMSHTTDPVTGQVVYDFLAKPDLVAPGVRVASLERDDNYLLRDYQVLHLDGTKVNGRYMVLSGSSMSAAVVSGAAALILQANPSLTPNMVKAILMYTAQMLEGADLFEQGAGLLNVDGAVRLARSLRQQAGSLPAGETLVRSFGLPVPQSTIAGETFAWSQGLIWGFGVLRGQALFTTQQEAYAQSLIWGVRRLDLWGAGVTYYDGLYSESYVAFAQNGQWCYVTWDGGSATSSGLIWTRGLYASGLIWGNKVIASDFFDVKSSGLIWGFIGYNRYASGLIWGITGNLRGIL